MFKKFGEEIIIPKEKLLQKKKWVEEMLKNPKKQKEWLLQKKKWIEEMLKEAKKGMVVTKKEHEEWHKKHDGCGDSKEHDACMKKWGITIKKKKK